MRDRAIAQRDERRFDVLVVGGGIIGAASAAQAAWGGLSVALVECNDFGSATKLEWLLQAASRATAGVAGGIVGTWLAKATYRTGERAL